MNDDTAAAADEPRPKHVNIRVTLMASDDDDDQHVDRQRFASGRRKSRSTSVNDASTTSRQNGKRVFFRPNGTPHVRSHSVPASLQQRQQQSRRRWSPPSGRRISQRLLRTHLTPRATGFSSFDRDQKLVFASLALVDFVSFCSMSIMAPFFPKEASAKGVNATVSGLVFSFYAFVMFISSPIFGKILPLVGAKFMFMSGMFVAGGCSIIFGLMDRIRDTTTFITYSFLLRGTEALGAAAYSTASYTFVADVFPEHIGPVMGILETFVGLGMSVGPALGGVLYSVGGFGLPFYTLGVVMVLFVPINIYLLPAAEANSVRPKAGSILEVLRVPSVIVIGLVVIVSAANWGFLDPTLEPHLRQYNLTPQQVGLVFLLSSGVYAAASPLWGLLATRIGSHWLMMCFGLVLCTIGLLTVGPSPLLPFLPSSLWVTLVSLAILGVAAALTLLPTYQAVLDAAVAGGCSDDLPTYSIVAGVWSGMYSLGEVIGPSVGGLVLEWYGFPTCATLMAGVTLGLAFLVLAFFSVHGQPVRPDKKQDDDEDDEGEEGEEESDEPEEPLLAERLSRHVAPAHNNYGSLDTNGRSVSGMLKTVSLTATGAVEV
ncbi:MFS-type transporter SLC18B1-like [Neocloeon triangulifer]|uniref:MFS-type transporter SLC18B1-like n=1 Tax=Neocloeon triangulifer TaxID=2078957 RepID=UPI00286FAA6D|nr:MFS-type transporter SLC18B1-like [Neocloeon triangulifer]